MSYFFNFTLSSKFIDSGSFLFFSVFASFNCQRFFRGCTRSLDFMTFGISA